jgi:hypothetical protein
MNKEIEYNIGDLFQKPAVKHIITDSTIEPIIYGLIIDKAIIIDKDAWDYRIEWYIKNGPICIYYTKFILEYNIIRNGWKHIAQ